MYLDLHAGNSSSYSSSKTYALQEIDLFLTSLLLGRHCHVLVSLEETFRRRLRAVTRFMSLLKRIISRFSVNTASAAIINDSAVTSALVADSSNSSIGVADARFAARRSSNILARFTACTADCLEVGTFHTRSRRGFLCHRHSVVRVFVSF